MGKDKLYTLIFLALSAVGILYTTSSGKINDLLTYVIIIGPVYLFGYFHGKLNKSSKKK